MMPTFASTRRAHRKDPAKQAAAPGFLKSGLTLLPRSPVSARRCRQPAGSARLREASTLSRILLASGRLTEYR
jgi:hypothetical protein